MVSVFLLSDSLGESKSQKKKVAEKLTQVLLENISNSCSSKTVAKTVWAYNIVYLHEQQTFLSVLLGWDYFLQTSLFANRKNNFC